MIQICRILPPRVFPSHSLMLALTFTFTTYTRTIAIVTSRHRFLFILMRIELLFTNWSRSETEQKDSHNSRFFLPVVLTNNLYEWYYSIIPYGTHVLSLNYVFTAGHENSYNIDSARINAFVASSATRIFGFCIPEIFGLFYSSSLDIYNLQKSLANFTYVKDDE